MSSKTNSQTATLSIKRDKPIRRMIGTSADAITATMVATRDVVQALGFEAKTMKLESYVDYKGYLNEVAKELSMTSEELEALMA